MGRAAGVSHCRHKNEERLQETFAQVREELLSTLTVVLGSRHDAQDAVQEAFLKCWQTRARISAVLNLRAYLFRIALNTARDLQRSAWRRRSRSLNPQFNLDNPSDSSPPDQLLHSEAMERLRKALSNLRPEEREVFLLRQNSDLTYDQIAVRRRTPVGTIKTQMRAALHKLRAVLHEKQQEPELALS